MTKKQIDPSNWIALGAIIGFVFSMIIFIAFMNSFEKIPCSKDNIKVTISGEVYHLAK